MRAHRKHPADRDRRAGAAPAVDEKIDAAAHAIFERHPGLCGFTLRFEGDAILADVSLSPYATPPESLDLFDDIAETMLAFVDEDARSAPLLARRTFARTLH
jgi:hypothetical protein